MRTEGSPPCFVVIEQGARGRWQHDLDLPIRIDRFPVLELGYRAFGTANTSREPLLILLVGTGRGRREVPVVEATEIAPDGEPHKISKDLTDLVPGSMVTGLVLCFERPAEAPAEACLLLTSLSFAREVSSSTAVAAQNPPPAIPVRVLRESGHPIEGATVGVDVARANWARWAKTDANGGALIQPVPNEWGQHTLRATADGAVVCEIPADAVRYGTVTIRLPTGTPLGGKVFAEDGNPVVNAVVSVRVRTAIRPGISFPTEAITLTDQDGAWRTSALPADIEWLDLTVRCPKFGDQPSQLRLHPGDPLLKALGCGDAVINRSAFSQETKERRPRPPLRNFARLSMEDLRDRILDPAFGAHARREALTILGERIAGKQRRPDWLVPCLLQLAVEETDRGVAEHAMSTALSAIKARDGHLVDAEDTIRSICGDQMAPVALAIAGPLLQACRTSVPARPPTVTSLSAIGNTSRRPVEGVSPIPLRAATPRLKAIAVLAEPPSPSTPAPVVLNRNAPRVPALLSPGAGPLQALPPIAMPSGNHAPPQAAITPIVATVGSPLGTAVPILWGTDAPASPAIPRVAVATGAIRPTGLAPIVPQAARTERTALAALAHEASRRPVTSPTALPFIVARTSTAGTYLPSIELRTPTHGADLAPIVPPAPRTEKATLVALAPAASHRPVTGPTDMAPIVAQDGRPCPVTWSAAGTDLPTIQPRTPTPGAGITPLSFLSPTADSAPVLDVDSALDSVLRETEKRQEALDLALVQQGTAEIESLIRGSRPDEAVERCRDLTRKYVRGPQSCMKMLDLMAMAHAANPQVPDKGVATDFLDCFPLDDPRRPTAEYSVGVHLYKNGEAQQACRRLATFLNENTDGYLWAKATLTLGLCQIRTGQGDQALTSLKALIERAPNAEEAAQTQFLVGWLHMTQQETAEANKAFAAVVRNYSDSPYAPKAAELLKQTERR